MNTCNSYTILYYEIRCDVTVTPSEVTYPIQVMHYTRANLKKTLGVFFCIGFI